MYEHEREKLINSLRKKNITDKEVLKAMLKVHRHLFVPSAMINHAYDDVPLPIGFDQTISQPYTVAFMTQLLRLKDGCKVLEIGTGSGYQAAILYEMGMKVFSIERNFELFNTTRKLLEALEYRVALKCGDGSIGWSEFAPYDGIIVTAGSPQIPKSLKKQLAENGRLVIPVGDRFTQSLFIVTREKDDFRIEEEPSFRFVPLIGREGWKER
ncbi:MAG: protein-L-isoaspartate(D-aspartate) O-methyltransferase [Ignavibacteriales bacterium]|nr:protein-L-isoaspartate(D-aspartate) O-methyltransferase [Ignavibacteriales bacterium]